MSTGRLHHHTGVLTIATAKPVYIRAAINLARSFGFWHRDSGIDFAIATDSPTALPPDLDWVTVIPLQPGDLPDGFSSKLYVDRLAVSRRTLFIDADCLCVRPLHDVFARFKGVPVGVAGHSISGGEWFGDIGTVLRRFQLSALPKFNGGIYYIERGSQSTGVYDTARALEADYDAMGLVRLRGRANDELLIAIALALHGIGPVSDDGTLMAEPYSCPEGLYVRALMGRARLINPRPPSPLHRPWSPLHVANPAIVHFLNDYTERRHYKAEEKKLRLVAQERWPSFIADSFVNLTYGFPQVALELCRDLARPLFHATFGPRPIVKSSRL
jgi:hypothetical protein